MKKSKKLNLSIHYLDDSKELLEAFGFYAREIYGCEVFTYSDPLSFLNELKNLNEEKDILLVDFDFKRPDVNGIKIIQSLMEKDYAGFSLIYLFTGIDEGDELLSDFEAMRSSRIRYLKKDYESFGKLLEEDLGLEG